ncbi:MAG: hypothetical protein ACOX3K_03990 [Bacilli bacterium]
MKKKIIFKTSLFAFLLLLPAASALAHQTAPAKVVKAANGDVVDFVLSPRDMAEGTLNVQSKFSAVHTNFNLGNTNQRAMVYMNAIKSGTEYIDISSYASAGRLEVLVYEGTTTEHINPFLVDKDGRTYIFGSTDAISMAGSAYYETKLDSRTPANNKNPSGWAMNNKSQLNYNWHGVPINHTAHSATAPEFVYYHLNLANRNYRSGYTEWAEGLGLAPVGNDFDFANVKLAGFYMNKQGVEETSVNWDIKVLNVSVRSTSTGARTVLFDARNAVTTTSNATLWNDRVDADGNSYVFTWINPGLVGCVTTEVGHEFVGATQSQNRPSDELNNGEITIKKGSGGFAWLWAFAKEYDRFVSIGDCTGFDATAWHINNTTGAQLKFDWYYVTGGNHLLNKMWLYPDADSLVQNVNNPVTSIIPAGFKGWVYSLFEQNATFVGKLNNLLNESRFVLDINDANHNKTFTLSSFRLIKNGAALRDKGNVDIFVKTLKLDTYDAGATGVGDGSCITYWNDVKTAYEALSESEKTLFWADASYAAARARFSHWAEVNGYALGGGSGLFPSAFDLDKNFAAIIMTAITLFVYAAGLLIAVNYKKNKKYGK